MEELGLIKLIEWVKNKRQARSMIHPDYANRFIRQYIIDEKELDIFGKIKETKIAQMIIFDFLS